MKVMLTKHKKLILILDVKIGCNDIQYCPNDTAMVNWYVWAAEKAYKRNRADAQVFPFF